MNKVLARIRNCSFFEVFNWKDERAKGRTIMIMQLILANIYSPLTAGVFYTGFLLANGIDMVRIGWLASIPFLTSIFGLLAPSILGHFPKRRWFLFVMRLLLHTFNILGITVLPLFPISTEVKIVMIAVLLFLANAINFSTGPAYSEWHLNFLPNTIRAKFFSMQMIIGNIVNSLSLFIAGIITDRIAGTPSEMSTIIALRFFAFGLAVIECLVLCLPKEYPYHAATTAKGIRGSLLATFTEPIKHPKFIRICLVMFAWTFSANLGQSAFDVFVLNELKIGYTEISVINAMYFLFILAISPFCQRFLRHGTWVEMYTTGIFMYAPLFLITLFLAPSNGVYLFPAFRLLQHAAGVALSLAYSNFSFLNLPKEGRTSCLAFQILCVNYGGFFGQLTGTSIVAAASSVSIPMFGDVIFNNVKLVLIVQMLAQLAIAFYTMAAKKKLIPDQVED